MRLPSAASFRAPVTSSPVTSSSGGEHVAGVTLLGVRVTAYATVNVGEHRRRETAGVSAVINPALLDRLLDLPAAVPVIDPVVWAEMADQPPGILDRGEDGASVTRRLESPLNIADVVVEAASGRELRAVQEASLFAGFARRWVAAAGGRIPDATLLEAQLCGVGVVDPGHRVLLSAAKPVGLTRDGWSWLLEEKVYRRWLSGRRGSRGTASPDPATDGARASRKG
jgi:hypothetical protein